MLQKLFARLGYERKESRTSSALIQLGLDTAVWTPRDYEQLTRAGYGLNHDVYSCVNLIARSAKPVPWLITKGEGGTSVASNHPLRALLKKPNEKDTGGDFIEAAIAYLLLAGNTYIERAGGNENEPPVWLYTNRPDRFRVIKGNRRQIVGGYEYKAGAEPVRFPWWQILHLKLFNPLDDWYGMSPIEAAAYTIDNSNEAAALYKKLLQKGHPPGAVMVKGVDYSDIQIKDLKVGLRRAQDNGDILLLQDAEWKEMGFKPVDSSIFEGKLFAKRDIAAIYGVPSGMIGDTQVKTYANSREERRSLYTEAVIPALTKLRDGLNNWLAPLYGDGSYIDIDKDAIDALAEDREVQAKRVATLFQADLIKRSEAREELKYEAIPDEEDGYYSDLAASNSQNEDQANLQVDEGEEPAAIRPNRPAPGRRREPIPIAQGRRALEGPERIKAFNLISEEQKDNHWKAVEDRRNLWYLRMGADVQDRFDTERNAVLKAFRDHGEIGALRAIGKQEEDWHKLYKSSAMAVAEDFGRQTIQSIKSEGYEPVEVKFEIDLFTRIVLSWILKEGGRRVVAVLDVTRASIRKELAAGVAAGEGIFELSKRLTAMYSEFSTVRAERIARTEVMSASSLGSQAAARATNLPLVKEWISTRDSRTRDTHITGNGQKQPLNEPYSIGGFRMMFPGDSSLGAPGDEIIQCRCSESYAVSRG